jgi:hypothetical protein
LSNSNSKVFSNLLIYFLVVNIKHMLEVCLAGRWVEAGVRRGVKMRTGVYLLLKLVYTL